MQKNEKKKVSEMTTQLNIVVLMSKLYATLCTSWHIFLISSFEGFFLFQRSCRNAFLKLELKPLWRPVLQAGQEESGSYSISGAWPDFLLIQTRLCNEGACCKGPFISSFNHFGNLLVHPKHDGKWRLSLLPEFNNSLNIRLSCTAW